MINKIDPQGKMVFKQCGFFYNAFGNDALILNKYLGYKLYGVYKHRTGFGVSSRDKILEKIDSLNMNYDLLDGKGNIIISKKFKDNRYEIIDPEYPIEGVYSDAEEPAKILNTKGIRQKGRMSKYVEILKGLGNGVNIFSGEMLENLDNDLKAFFMELAEYFDEKLKSKDALEKKYPRHGTKWSIDEDKQIIDEFINGKSINEISEAHQRGRGSVTQRLLKLNVIKKPDDLPYEMEINQLLNHNEQRYASNVEDEPPEIIDNSIINVPKLEVLCFSCKFYEECGTNGKTKCHTYERRFNLSSHDKRLWAELGDSSSKNRFEDYKNALEPDLTI